MLCDFSNTAGFKMDPNLVFQTPSPLDPAWLAHEKSANLLSPAPVLTSPSDRQQLYADTCRKLNTELLSGRDKNLTEGIKIQDTGIEPSPDSSNLVKIPIRSYIPSGTAQDAGNVPIVIYFHGGGLYVGDLDSEDLTCRRICKSLNCTVYSVDYRLMPDHTASDALADAIAAFRAITSSRNASRLIVMGSSSGGQLAAQVSQHFKSSRGSDGDNMRIHGVLLRGPVTCDATGSGKNLPARFKDYHTSMSEAFYTSLLSNAAVNGQNRTKEPLPLEVEDLSGLPRHWIQVSTNDIYYSDGACYAEALRRQGVDVKLDLVVGWPHTFWLKAPLLERAVQAERDMIEGLSWLLESDVEGVVDGK
ncbi:Alpha/Beta hydrolase protein [Cadophora sp. MPI-SDFR-AT-0126]|nr:Alpha/Beta hydrolase protein [Leotiomycetes sp. MPI-SDFR-AT-0126]